MRSVISAMCVMCGAAGAFAGSTPVNTATPSDAVGIVDILNYVYGGSFVGGVGTVLTNGSVSAQRINDYVGSPLNPGANPLLLGTGTGDSDQVWRDGTVSFVAQARFAGYKQHFGYRNSTAGGVGATNQVQVQGVGFNVSGSGSWTVGPGDFQWLRAGNATFTNSNQDGLVYSSIANNNLDHADHMVAYRISGLGPAMRYMLFWEDLPALRGSLPGDYDYNDLAVEIQTLVVPLPTGAGLAGLGLFGLALRRRR